MPATTKATMDTKETKSLQVGQTVWVLNIGNYARHTPQKLRPHLVTAVGRKYFNTKAEGDADHMTLTFHLDGWRQKTEYSAGFQCYPNPQAREDEKELAEINGLISKTFQYGRSAFTLDQLRRIKAILDEPHP
jgi:hypothetical protein